MNTIKKRDGFFTGVSVVIARNVPCLSDRNADFHENNDTFQYRAVQQAGIPILPQLIFVCMFFFVAVFSMF